MFDGFFATNNFDEPEIVEGINAAQVMLIRLFLLEKNTIQSHPDMGIGIVSRWRFRDNADLSSLSVECQNQIETYLPQLAGSTVDLVPQGKDLYIKVTHNNIVYGFKLNDETGSFGPLY